MRLCAVPHGPEVRVNFPQKGVNNKAKAKAIKRMAYGVRDDECFFLEI